MGTTTATLYVKPSASAYLSVNASSEANFFVALRALAGLYSGTGINKSANLRGLRSMLPSAATPIGYVVVNGARLPVLVDDTYWYSFFDFFVNTYLDFNSGVTLADLKLQITADQALAIANSALGLATSQQIDANAQALAAAIEVLRAASLPGSGQIPPPQLNRSDGAGEGGGDDGGDDGDL